MYKLLVKYLCVKRNIESTTPVWSTKNWELLQNFVALYNNSTTIVLFAPFWHDKPNLFSTKTKRLQTTIASQLLFLPIASRICALLLIRKNAVNSALYIKYQTQICGQTTSGNFWYGPKHSTVLTSTKLLCATAAASATTEFWISPDMAASIFFRRTTVKINLKFINQSTIVLSLRVLNWDFRTKKQ